MSSDETGRRCAVYVRSASHPQSETSISWAHAQRAACLEFIRRKPGWQPKSPIYMDVGFSGEDLDRPALQRLLFDIEAGEVDIVVAHDIERLTRSSLDLARLIEIFRKAGVGLAVVAAGEEQTDAPEPVDTEPAA